MLRRRHERACVGGREGQRRHALAEGGELAAPPEGTEREELLERGSEGRARGRLHEVEVVHVRDAEDLEREHDARERDAMHLGHGGPTQAVVGRLRVQPVAHA